MKKNARKVFLFALALLTVISMGSVSGTYAKYTSKLVDQTDKARVAYWNFNNEYEVTDLFHQSYMEYNNQFSEYDEAYPDDTTVVGKYSNNVIAPGTRGSYKFKIGGTAETNYTIDVKVEGTDTVNNAVAGYSPIVYTLDGVEYNDIDDLVAAIEALYDEYKDEVFAAGSTFTDAEHTIGWYWTFEEGDTEEEIAEKNENDTKLAGLLNPLGDYDYINNTTGEEDQIPTVSLKISITANQSILKATK